MSLWIFRVFLIFQIFSSFFSRTLSLAFFTPLFSLLFNVHNYILVVHFFCIYFTKSIELPIHENPILSCFACACMCMWYVCMYIRFDCSVYRYLLLVLIRIGSHYSYCKLLHHTLIIFSSSFSLTLRLGWLSSIFICIALKNTQNAHKHTHTIALYHLCGRSLINCCFF